MLKNNYEIKADLSLGKAETKYKIAMHPAGHQYSGQVVKDIIKLHGFKSIKDAKKAGWSFK